MFVPAVMLTLMTANGGPAGLAYDSHEHEQLSNMSFAIARERMRGVQYGPAVRDRRRSRGLEYEQVCGEYYAGLPSGNGKSTHLTYGHVVALVDSIRDVFGLVRADSVLAGWPTEASQLDLDLLLELSTNTESFVIASHENYGHFQGRATRNFGLWHDQAVRVAEEGNLFGALLVSAYADHFLQDWLAPGHVAAPRSESSHDLATLSWHDLHNRKGLTYTLAAARDLVPIAAAAEQLATNAGGVLRASFYARKNSLQFELPVSASRFGELRVGCGAGSYAVQCKGDGYLEQDSLQLAFMSVYAARSVLDVLESWASATAVNSFAQYEWRGELSEDAQGGLAMMAHGGLGFGVLRVGESPGTAPSPLSLDDGSSVPRADREFSVVAPLTAHYWENPVFGLSFGMQGVAHHAAGSVRSVWNVDCYSPRAIDVLGRGRALRPREWISSPPLILGASGVVNLAYGGLGPSVRVFHAIPSWNIEFSVVGGARYYDIGAGWGKFLECRADWGLHMVNLFVSVGQDTFWGRDQLEEGSSFTAGISLAAPARTWAKESGQLLRRVY